MGRNSEDNGGRSDKMVVSASLKTKLSDVPKLTSERCIYRIPRKMRSANEEAYTPQKVSIGPYHRGTSGLQSMEVNKLHYVQKFLDRNPEKTVEFYVEEFTRLEERARQCYAESVNLTRNEFVEMLLIDGCFIVELMLVCCTPGDSSHFRWSMMVQFLTDDMQLMENQLPFFVLEHLYNLINSTDSCNTSPPQPSFLDLASDFFSIEREIGPQRDVVRTSEYHQIKHFLDLYTAYHVPSSPRIRPKDSTRKFPNLPSITELHEAGVKFQNVENNCFLDIKFTDTGILNIPRIQVSADTEIFLRNFMAFEHFNDQTFYVTDYTALMESLVQTPNDVAILRTCGVVDSLRSDEEVSHFFNKLCMGTGIQFDTFYYSSLCEDVHVYYKRRWNRWRAILKRDYFNTPWSTLSFIAAVVLLICSLVQSVFSVIAASGTR